MILQLVVDLNSYWQLHCVEACAHVPSDTHLLVCQTKGLAGTNPSPGSRHMIAHTWLNHLKEIPKHETLGVHSHLPTPSTPRSPPVSGRVLFSLLPINCQNARGGPRDPWPAHQSISVQHMGSFWLLALGPESAACLVVAHCLAALGDLCPRATVGSVHAFVQAGSPWSCATAQKPCRCAHCAPTT